MRFLIRLPFWQAARELGLPSGVGAVVIILVCLEAVSRIAPIAVGKQVHQRYLYSTRICAMDCTNKGKPLTWMANGRGARGDLFHGQPVEIAVFGSSTSEDALLDHEQTWAQRLKQELGRDLCHVDNFGRDDSYIGEATIILQEFGKTGKHYDIVLLQVIGSPTGRKASERTAFHYWGKWPLVRRKLTFRSMLPARIAVQASSEPRLVSAYRLLQTTQRPPRVHPPRNSRANRHLRASGQVQLRYRQRPLTDQAKDSVRSEMRRLVEVARVVADHVYVISQPVAYDENAHAGVAQKWFSLYPIPGEQAYYDNRSVAEWIRAETALITDVARQMGVSVIDLDDHMRPQLATRDDLFDDKWHYAPAGAEVAAKHIASFLRSSANARVGGPPAKHRR